VDRDTGGANLPSQIQISLMNFVFHLRAPFRTQG
jgi:hypothetical protein